MGNSLTAAEYNPENLEKDFTAIFGAEGGAPRIYASPARINIIGEHIDYNGGKVFPASINRYLYVAVRRRGDKKILYRDAHFPGEFEFSVQDNFVYDKKNGYANYLNGIVSQLKERGCVFDSGFEILIASNIPAGGGISSSSALECGFAYAVSDLFGFGIDRAEIAKLGQMSEHQFMNVNCGIMDQFIIANGKRNTAMILDCATLAYEYVPLELGDYRFVVMNTNKTRKLADSKYNERRSQCESALKILRERGVKIDALCQLKPDEWEDVQSQIGDEVLRKRARHCVYENRRVLDAAAALKKGDLAALGALLNQSHESLRHDYEVTGAELDTLAAASQKAEGCLGARMTGAGFGGCAIALVHKDAVEAFTDSVQAVYQKAIGYGAGFFACESGDGVFRWK